MCEYSTISLSSLNAITLWCARCNQYGVIVPDGALIYGQFILFKHIITLNSYQTLESGEQLYILNSTHTDNTR